MDVDDGGRPSRTARSSGFTLVELVVVMLILSILAAIAVPVLVSQRSAAHDSATKADVSNLGKQIATYHVGGRGPLVLDHSVAGRVTLREAGSPAAVARLTVGARPPATGASAALDDPTGWCVSLTDPDGRDGTYRYTARDGLQVGDCS